MQRAASPLLRRPNGRPQACEPCRKRKVACDHTHPVCNRCRKRRQADDCVYVVSGQLQLQLQPRARSSVPSTVRKTPRPLSPAPSASSGASRLATADVVEAAESRSTDPRQMASGYLGFTSFSAVYEETQNSLTRLQGGQISQTSQDSPATPPEPDAWRYTTPVPDQFVLSDRTRDACLFVLRNVPEPSKSEVWLGGSPCETWYRGFLDRVLKSFYQTFGHYFGPRRNDKALEELAVVISRNSTLPFSDDNDIQPGQWIAQFSGPRTRWETVGLLFGFWVSGMNPITSIRNSTRDDCRPRHVTKQCLDHCVELCHEFSPANSVLLLLTLRRLIMETVLYGDMSRRSWLFLGEVITLLTFLGYHALVDPPDYQPKFMIEVKKRIYYRIYNIHMTLVSLTGRPPLMSQSYHTTSLPLDVSDAVLFGEKEEGIVATAADISVIELDQDARRFSVTLMRTRAELSLIREEIMHFALSTKKHVSVEELLDVKAREYQTFEKIPNFMKYNDNDLADQKHEVGILYWKLLMRLEHLLNVFFIERLLLKHGHTQSELLSVSFDMLTYTLPFWTHQDILLPLRGDCAWLIMSFGVPPGGILCQELLKPTMHGDPRITRSSLIQKLSLLVGFLDWIKPEAPNGDLCGKCKTIIKHVLDQALNGPALGYDSMPGAAFDWDFTTQLDFDFDLLDTFGWARSEPSSSQQINV